MGRYMSGWVVWSKIYDLWNGWGHFKSQNLINLDLIEIMQFCLKIYDLWINGWLNLMDILTFFDFLLLKPTQSLTGL